MSNWFSKLFSDIGHWFSSPKGQAIEKDITALLPIGMAVVSDINALAPNRTLTQINAVAQKYVVPTVDSISSDPQLAGNTLLNLATNILQTKLPAAQATASTALLNTVVQLAVMGAKAGATTSSPV